MRSSLAKTLAAIALLIPASAGFTAPPSHEGSVRDENGVYRESGFRLPLLQREALDAEGQRVFDKLSADMNSPQRGSSGPGVGFKGPSGITLYSPRLAEINSDLNSYLRFQAGFDGRTREVAILAVARETGNAFEWAAHEPIARRENVPEAVIAAIRDRAATGGLSERERIVIDLAREGVTAHRVSRQTFDSALNEFGPKALTNLVALMGNYLSTALLLDVFAMQTPPGKASLPQPGTDKR